MADVVIDSYSEAYQDSYVVTSDSVDKSPNAGQCFYTGSKDWKLTRCKFYWSWCGYGTELVYARIYAMTGTAGTDGHPTGSPLATSDEWTPSGAGYALREFTFSGAEQITLNKETWYCVQLIDTNVSRNNRLGLDITSPSHAGNACVYMNGVWDSGFYGDEICFYVYGEDLSASAVSNPTLLTLGVG